MIIDSALIEDLIFKRYPRFPTYRFTQDSPIYPDVWLEYFKHRSELKTYRADLILTPHRDSSASVLFSTLSTVFKRWKIREELQMATSGDSVVIQLTFFELINIALPMTNWWQKYLIKDQKVTEDFIWLAYIVGTINLSASNKGIEEINSLTEMEEYFISSFNESKEPATNILSKKEPIILWSVNRNRKATLSIYNSVPATKADSGRRVFDIDGKGICWAVLDSGIDARHSAFRMIDKKTKLPYEFAMGDETDKYSNNTRILATYDFTKFRSTLVEIHGQNIVRSQGSSQNDESLSIKEIDQYLTDIKKGLNNGRMLDWTVIGPLLRIPHNNAAYLPPVHPHGTHVAGIIGANTESTVTQPLIGMCPGIDLYDIRVVGDDGAGEEFNIMAAVQFIRWLNNQKDIPIIHGINMSLSMTHDVASYACGQTPVCMACERLVAEGTVVVAAAGNLGQAMFRSKEGDYTQGFRMVNITDPGNADRVITVGATHRDQPHTYGVSYFSSKGPTGDGRIKPDLVAPGEKIVSASIDEGIERMDGTSMAAPHVSGAAALILAKHRELIGRPGRIKEILCASATDLGREKYFQGHGMLDVLRAIQSV